MLKQKHHSTLAHNSNLNIYRSDCQSVVYVFFSEGQLLVTNNLIVVIIKFYFLNTKARTKKYKVIYISQINIKLN